MSFHRPCFHRLASALVVAIVAGSLLLAPVGATPVAPRASGSPPAVALDLSRLPLSFEENRGQAHDSVRFLSRGAGYALYLTPSEVRGERSGQGDGRVYEIRFTASDSAGGSCTGAVKVGVPADQGKRRVPVDSGVRYDSTVAGGSAL